MFSQFASEDEILFPPMTMLQVLGNAADANAAADDADAGAATGRRQFEECVDGQKEYIAINVMPSFL